MMGKFSSKFNSLLIFILIAMLASAGGVFAFSQPTGSVDGSVLGHILIDKKLLDGFNALESSAKAQGKSINIPRGAGKKINKNGDLDVSRGLGGVEVTVGAYTTTTQDDGTFNIGDISVGTYSYKVKMNGRLLREGTVEINPSLSSKIDVNLFSDMATVEKSMGHKINLSSQETGVTPQTHTHGGAPHCNKAGTPGRWAFPANNSDCAWALFVAYNSYCWGEAMNNDDEGGYNRWCNGNGKVYKYYAPDGYTGWHGINCSYFRGHKEYYHYN